MIDIPESACCLIPGCPNEPELALSIRLRTRETNAIWAPETHAYACLRHGNSGAWIAIDWKPSEDGKIHTYVTGHPPDTQPAERTTSIRREPI